MIKKDDTILFIGLGGAGQRHLRIFRELLPNNRFIALRNTNSTPVLNPDFSVDKNSSLEEKYNILNIFDPKKISSYKPKLTIISTPTIYHVKDSQFAHSLGSHVFVEKPGISNKSEVNTIERIFKNSNLSYKVGFQRIYHPMVRKFLEEVQNSTPNEKFICKLKLSSYVPDWHPYESYKELYACRDELGGGVILTECHEIDIINSIFGDPIKVKKTLFKNKIYSLNVEDTAEIEIEYEKCSLKADISFMRKPLERYIHIESNVSKYFLDLNTNTLNIEKNNSKQTISYILENNELFKKQAQEIIKLENNNRDEITRLKRLASFLD